MNKRILLWGGLAAAMLLVVAVMYHFAQQDTTSPIPVKNTAAAAVNQNVESGILTVREDDWTKGNPDASVVVVKYSDFQCPACRFYASMDDLLSREMADDVLFVYRHFPLRNFRFSMLAAQYAEAAGRQDQFWRMHDLIYINQQHWARGDGEQIFREFAESLGLDMEQLDQDLEDPALTERIQDDYRDGQRLGIRAVPTIYVQGQPVDGISSIDEYRELISSHL